MRKKKEKPPDDSIHITVAAFLVSRKSDTTRLNYESGLKQYSEFKFGTSDLSRLDPYISESSKSEIYNDLLRYSTYLKKPKKRRNGLTDETYVLSKATQRSYLMTIRVFLGLNEITFSNLHREPLKINADEPIRDLAFTLESAKKTYDQLSIPMRSIFLVLLSSGARISEVLNIRLQDVFWNENPCRVTLTRCKGGGIRDVFISNEAREYLKNVWLPRRESYIVRKTCKSIGLAGRPKSGKFTILEPYPESILLFPVTRTTVQEAIRRGVIAAGYPEKTPTGGMKLHLHSCRKFFRNMVGRHGSPDSAEFLMGHSPGLLKNYRILEGTGQLEADYIKAMPYLELSHTPEARKAIERNDEQAISIASLQAANTEMQKELAELRHAGNIAQVVAVKEQEYINDRELLKALQAKIAYLETVVTI